MGNYLLNEFQHTVKFYKTHGFRGPKKNLVSYDNPIVQDFFSKWLDKKINKYNNELDVYDLNPVYSILADKGIVISPFISCFNLGEFTSNNIIRRNNHSLVIGEGTIDFRPSIETLDILPSDIIMYMLITNKFEEFVDDNLDAIKQILKQNHILYATSKRTGSFDE